MSDSAKNAVFPYGDEVIHYEVVRKAPPRDSAEAPARKVVIRVHPDQRVVATAPHDASDADIHDAVQKRARWIWQSIESFAVQHEAVLPRQYVSGETQFYLGKRYVLKVVVDASQTPRVSLSRGKLNVTLKQRPTQGAGGADNQGQRAQVKPLIDRWYQHKAKAVFHERLAALLPRTTWVTGIPSFRLMAMKKQWGSCSAKGNLLLNPHLVKAPKECIDYVILHELCHIAEHNHGERFWRLLTQSMPNWQAVKAKLDEMAELYLNE